MNNEKENNKPISIKIKVVPTPTKPRTLSHIESMKWLEELKKEGGLI